MVRCRVCGKELFTSLSVERRIGPVCWSRLRSIDGIEYVAIIPHSILETDDPEKKVLIEYPEKGILKRGWFSIKELEDRGVIKRLEEAE